MRMELERVEEVKELMSSRRAFREHRSDTVRNRGATGSENVGTSSENYVRIIVPINLRFPTEGQSASG